MIPAIISPITITINSDFAAKLQFILLFSHYGPDSCAVFRCPPLRGGRAFKNDPIRLYIGTMQQTNLFFCILMLIFT
ncbi:MAG: hypothetical protein K2G18_03470, partial [Bacteroidales bacterium]|nr:hypothetical protein [Bacteroidales bacterium]